MATARHDQPDALVHLPPRAAGEAPQVRLSSSLDTCEPGDIVCIDEQGRPLDRRQRQWAMVRQSLALCAAVFTVVLLVGVWLDLAAGFIAGGTLMLLHAQRQRRAYTFVVAMSLASAGRREEARALVHALEQRRLPTRLRRLTDHLAGKLEWQFARPAAALARFERVLAPARGGRRRDGNYWICAFDRAQLLAVMGRHAEADGARRELDEAPEGDYFTKERILTDLALAFHRDDPGELSLETLHAWTAIALRSTRFGTTVVLLAWAFDRLGDPEMAEHLLAEAPSRLGAEFLAETMPRLHAWMIARRRAVAELAP